MTLKEFNMMFTDDCQYIRLYDLANNDIVIFEGQIKDTPSEYLNNKLIVFETMYEEYFDGYFGIFIATENEDDYYDEYYEDE